jgi:ribose 5-phosphate isomerase B
MSKILIASDHAGYAMKHELITHYPAYDWRDFGPDNSQNNVDYPDFANKLCEILKTNIDARGVLICGTGLGMSMAANRHPHIRAALCHDAYTAAMCKAHNDANILCMGARVLGLGTAESIIKAYCETHFEGGRHAQRLCKF